jgi:general secretion pathway protein G
MQTLRKRAQRRGFTLIELLVVIIILAILAAVVIPNVINRTSDARKSKALADIAAIDSALDAYKLDTGSYPPTLDSLQNNSGAQGWNGPYLKGGLPNDPWGTPYYYVFPGTRGEYDIASSGEDHTPGTGDDLTTQLTPGQ